MLAFPLTRPPGHAIMAIMIRFLFALGMIAWAVPIAAQSKLPPFDPARIEFATPTTQSASCIDDLKNGICALHAVIACETFVRRPQCARLAWPPVVFNTNPDYRPKTRLEYRIVAAGIVSREAVRRFDRETNRERFVPLSGLAFIEPGLLQARVFERSCGPGVETCADVPWMETLYGLRRVKGSWVFAQASLFDASVWLVGPLNDP